MIRAFASGQASYGWKGQAKLMVEAHSLPYDAAYVAFMLNPEPVKFVLESKRGPRGGRGKFFYNEDSSWPVRWVEMAAKGDVHAVWPILKRMKGRLDGARVIGFEADLRSSPTGRLHRPGQFTRQTWMDLQQVEAAIRSLQAWKGAFDDTR